jgi:serine protease Do
MMARGLGLPMAEGVILGDVYPGGPAAEAGLLAGDIVTHLDGKPMENGRQFEVNLYFKEIGGVVDIDFVRGIERRTATVKVIERPDSSGILGQLPNLERSLVAGLGILAVPLNEEIARRLPRLRATSGVIVAARAGALASGSSPLRSGDIIYAVNGARIETVGSLRAFVDATDSGDPLVLQVERQGRLQYVTTLRE